MRYYFSWGLCRSSQAVTGLPVGAQIFFMGLNCTVIYSAAGIGSKAILRTRPASARRVSQFSGIVMIVIAFLLIGDQVTIALK